MVIVAASDQHLGYAKADKAAFNSFLDSLQAETDITDLVLIGDVVDMWRRDASGVFLENQDTIEKILSLMKTMKVHYIAGNHDFHVLSLKNHSYPLTFDRNLSLTDGGKTYRFVHGYEFDWEQQPPLMEALCRVMSDGGGTFESGAWATLTRDWTDLEYFLATFSRKGKIHRRVDKLQMPPETRLIGQLSEVEKRACESVQAGETLVFGHTHHPFINTRGNVVNCGSWVTDAPVHNTYVRIEGGQPRLFVFAASSGSCVQGVAAGLWDPMGPSSCWANAQMESLRSIKCVEFMRYNIAK